MEARFSIVIPVHNEGQEIATALPSLLSQQYEGGYEVIVVDDSSTDDTPDVLKQLKASHQHLYTTFLPKYHFRTNRRRLASTLGVKAAKHEWIIFADVTTPPSSDQWLKELSDFIDGNAKLMIGYVRKNGDVRLQLFNDLQLARATVGKAERLRSGALSTTMRRPDNVHKSKRLRYLRGKYDFLVVRADCAHELLRFYELDIQGLRLLGYRLRVFFYNLFH